MRFWAIGCTVAVLAIAGCGDKTDQTSAVKGGTGTSTAVANSGPLDKLKVDDIKPGTGPEAKNGDTLLMEYTGTLANGTVFDSTSKRDDAPFGFVLGSGQVIKGWDQGLVGMKEGGERKLSIPSSLGYGGEAKGDTIPANSDLYFDVKLDKVVPASELDDVTVQITKHGTGRKVKKGDAVEVIYTGSFVNGKQFDTNRKPDGKPLPVVVGAGGVVPGFDKALDGMQVGERRIVTIPPQWGYGPQGQGPIPANSWLVFDIEIKTIK